MIEVHIDNIINDFLIYATNLENFLICGMINTNLVNFEDTFFLENIIYNELKARDYEVFTGKTYKGGMDFVVINGRKKCFYSGGILILLIFFWTRRILIYHSSTNLVKNIGKSSIGVWKTGMKYHRHIRFDSQHKKLI